MILVHPLIPLILVQIHVAGVCDTPLRILVKLLLNIMPTMILCRVSTDIERCRDDARPSEKILVHPLIPYPERSRGESWFKSPGLSNNPFSPLNTLIYERFPNNPFFTS